jgi:hypothetical protein
MLFLNLNYLPSTSCPVRLAFPLLPVASHPPHLPPYLFQLGVKMSDEVF